MTFASLLFSEAYLYTFRPWSEEPVYWYRGYTFLSRASLGGQANSGTFLDSYAGFFRPVLGFWPSP